MKIVDVRRKANEMGLTVGIMKKADMIRAIQVAEGNLPCFGTAPGYCDQIDCLWRDDCLSAS